MLGHPIRVMRPHPRAREHARVDNRPDVGDAAIALAAVAYNLARIPAHMAQRLPGMGVLAAEGAAVRARLMSRLEGVAADVADRLLLQATDRVLSGPEVQRVIEHVASSPEVRAALTAQSTTMAEEMVATVRNRAETMDDAAERTVRGWLRRPRPA